MNSLGRQGETSLIRRAGDPSPERPLASPRPACVAAARTARQQVSSPPPPANQDFPTLAAETRPAGADADFDPYYQWLGIPPESRPPNCYELLGLRLWESNSDVIENAAHRQMLFLRSVQAGQRGPLSQRLLNEISAAKLLLLDPLQKQAFDQRLRDAAAKQNVGMDNGNGRSADQPPPLVAEQPPPLTPRAKLRADAAGGATFFRRPGPPPSVYDAIPLAELVAEEELILEVDDLIIDAVELVDDPPRLLPLEEPPRWHVPPRRHS